MSSGRKRKAIFSYGITSSMAFHWKSKRYENKWRFGRVSSRCCPFYPDGSRRRLCRQTDSRIIPATVELWSTETRLLPRRWRKEWWWLRGWSGEYKEHMRNPVKALRGQEDWCHCSLQGHNTKSVEEEAWEAHLCLYEIVSMHWPLLPSCFPFKSWLALR